MTVSIECYLFRKIKLRMFDKQHEIMQGLDVLELFVKERLSKGHKIRITECTIRAVPCPSSY